MAVNPESRLGKPTLAAQINAYGQGRPHRIGYTRGGHRQTSSSPPAKCRLKSGYPRPGVRDELQSVRDEIQMNVAALFTWMVTILAGLILLVIWIIEYDREFQTAAATRLPVPVISAHVLLGMGGLMLWVSYLVIDEERPPGPDHGGALDPRVPRRRQPRPVADQDDYRPSGTELPAAGRRGPRHPGRHHPRPGAAHRARPWPEITRHRRGDQDGTDVLTGWITL